VGAAEGRARWGLLRVAEGRARWELLRVMRVEGSWWPGGLPRDFPGGVLGEHFLGGIGGEISIGGVWRRDWWGDHSWVGLEERLEVTIFGVHSVLHRGNILGSGLFEGYCRGVESCWRGVEGCWRGAVGMLEGCWRGVGGLLEECRRGVGVHG
jgi:hypothetical protein